MPVFSFWEKDSFFAPQDVVIVGSGFAGLWAALHLISSHPGKKITILERGLIPAGASTRNAGFSCFGSPSELLNDAVTMGEEKMWQLVEMRYKGLQLIRDYFSDSSIAYDASGGYECFTSQSADWHNCLAKIDWLNGGLQKITGIKNLFKVADEKLATFGFTGFAHLIENRLEAGLQPGKLIQALLKKVQGLGVQVVTGTEVHGFEQKEGYILVKDNQQINLRTKKLLLCTNAFTQSFIPSIDIISCRGQVLITNPIEGLQMKGSFHFDKGYYYFRNVGNRLLIGGARNKDFEAEQTNQPGISDKVQNELELFIRTHLLKDTPFSITDRWSGIMAMGSEKLPIVKTLHENIYCCVRMSGMGVALAPIVAKQAVERFLI